ncbi:putative quinol monooxygenase [Chelatococcus reniformis]|uniref:ABM domain-containing protein n=1 Tax=Chelatococcus reniformis TaxID=1494448 RepID=A0A916XGN0_9HYPH|nr:putative quinol monooxygenase [Chelatococcus reniformis]GGC69175.1 hypothetical protein GCM10010994_29630 [Chelatococcus reniformis]
MHTVTAIIRVKPGAEHAMRDGLLAVAAHARANEPGTIGYFVSQDGGDPCLFTTYERYADQAAMDSHNGSAVVARFFETAAPLLDGAVTLVMGAELSTTG